MSAKRLQAENDDLRRRLEEAEDTLRAIQTGVDAVVVHEAGERRVYTLEGAERPYRMWLEKMQQGAATLYRNGTIAYCNQRVADLLGVPHEQLVGTELRSFVPAEEQA